MIGYIGKILIDGKPNGTGFVVDVAERLVATAYHVICQGKQEVEVSRLQVHLFRAQKALAVKEVVASSPIEHEDVALLEIADPLPIELAVPPLIADVLPATKFTVTGFGNSYEYRSAEGSVAGYFRKERTSPEVYQVDAPHVFHGMSGSPAIIQGKGIFGILTDRGSDNSTLKGQALVLPITVLASLDRRVEMVDFKYLRDLEADIHRRKAREVFRASDDYIHLPVTVEPEQDRPINTTREIPSYLRRFVIVGEAGTGKTATLDYLLQEAINEYRASKERRLPLRVDLSRWETQPEFVHFLKDVILSDPTFRRLRAIGDVEELIWSRVSLFLDGLDELANKRLRALSDWLQKVDNVPVVITCRKSHYEGLRKIPTFPAVFLNPLGSSQIYEFASAQLGRERADSFTSTLLPRGFIEEEGGHISQLARIPIYLVLMLDQYKPQEQQTNIGRWHLFSTAVRRVWRSDRVQEMLLLADLTATYADVSSIIKVLSSIVGEAKDISARTNERTFSSLEDPLLKVLREIGLLEFRNNKPVFSHQLFEDFFAAHYLLGRPLNSYIANSGWHNALIILSDRTTTDHEQVERGFLAQLQQNAGKGADLTSHVVDSLLAALGELGSINALDKLIDLSGQFPHKRSLLLAIGKIANRLPAHSEGRSRAIRTIRPTMFALSSFADAKEELEQAIGGYPYEFWGASQAEAVGACEAMSQIKSQEALEALLEAIEDIADKSRKGILAGQWLRQQWFASYLASMGEWAVPTLLEAMETDNFELSSTIADALSRMQRPLPIKQVGEVVLTHPNPAARWEAARILGRSRNPEAVVFLVGALQDKGIWLRGGMLSRFVFFFVADMAAIALAVIGTPEAEAALATHYYTPDGAPTPELLLQRLEGRVDEVFHDNTLRQQLARTIMATWPDQIPVLISRMGHLKNVGKHGFLTAEPIAGAFIDRFVRSHSSHGFGVVPPPENYHDVTPQLLEHLRTSTDLTSRRWTCVVLGHVADKSQILVLETLLNEPTERALYEAAAYGLGKLVSRHRPKNTEIASYIDSLLLIIPKVSPQLYGGLGLALASLIAVTQDSHYPKVSNKLLEKAAGVPQPEGALRLHRRLIDSLLHFIHGSDVQASKVALDALETICVRSRQLSDNPRVHEVLEFTPGYPFKMALKVSEHNDRLESVKQLSGGIDYEEARDLYYDAYRRKHAPNPWTTLYSERDWSELGCSDVELLYNIAKQEMALEAWTKAADTLLRAEQAFFKEDTLPPVIRSTCLMVLLELGNIHFRFLNNHEEARAAYESVLALAQEIVADGEIPVEIFGIGGLHHLQRIYLLANTPSEAIRVGQIVLDIAEKVYADINEEKALIYFEMGQAQYQLGSVSKSLAAFEAAAEHLRYSLRRFVLANVFLQVATLKQELEYPIQEIEKDILKAQKILKRAGDDEGVAQTLTVLAVTVEAVDPARAEQLYLQSLELVEKATEIREPDARARVLFRLALLKQNSREFARAEEYFREAIDLLEELNIPEFLFPVLSHYGKLLHEMGHEADAITFLTELMQRQLLGGLDPTVTHTILTEIDAVPGGDLPRSALHRVVETVIDAARHPRKRDRILELLFANYSEAAHREMHHEQDFFAALIATLQEQVVSLDDNNPYYEFFEEVHQTLARDNQGSDFLCAYMIKEIQSGEVPLNVLRDKARILGMWARLSGKPLSEQSFQGIFEYLNGSKLEDLQQANVPYRVIEVWSRLDVESKNHFHEVEGSSMLENGEEP